MGLSWLGGNKVDHPMADPKRAREIVAELQGGDAVKTLAEIADWLESLNRTEGFRTERRFELVDLLDGAAKQPQRKVAQDYLATPRRQKFQENRLWTGVFGCWQQLGNAYLRCVQEHETGASGATAVRKSVPVIVARALRALNVQVKWTLLRYGSVEPRLWADLARLYRLAEQKGYADSAITIYPGANGSGTVKGEFLKAMMLFAASTDGLSPVKQEIAERVVAHFCGEFALGSSAAGCTHCFDVAAPAAPVRLFNGAASKPTLRFFGAGQAQAGLARLAEQIERNGSIPPDVNLGGSYDKELVGGVLRHVARCWSDTPPARAAERKPIATQIAVVPGFKDILVTLDPSNGDELDFSEQQNAAEKWIVENMSDGGYGAIVPQQRGDWIGVGTLIVVQGETSGKWELGLVRRLSRDNHSQRRVGIELLTKRAIPIRIAKSGTHSGSDAGRELQPAILLSDAPDGQGEVGVILREGLFNGRDSLDMQREEKLYLLMPARLVEDGEDFSWAKFKVIQRDD